MLGIEVLFFEGPGSESVKTWNIFDNEGKDKFYMFI